MSVSTGSGFGARSSWILCSFSDFWASAAVTAGALAWAGTEAGVFLGSVVSQPVSMHTARIVTETLPCRNVITRQRPLRGNQSSTADVTMQPMEGQTDSWRLIVVPCNPGGFEPHPIGRTQALDQRAPRPLHGDPTPP